MGRRQNGRNDLFHLQRRIDEGLDDEALVVGLRREIAERNLRLHRHFQRIRGNLFYDYTHANDFYTNGSVFSGNFRSTGAEIYFDTKWFNQEAITFGFRYSYLNDPDLFGGTGRNRIEFVLPVSLFN